MGSRSPSPDHGYLEVAAWHQDTFTPRWASPPGRTIRRALDARGVSVAQFASAAGMSPQAAESLLAGRSPITMASARRLESIVGGSVAFWLQRDGQYRDSLALVEADRWAGAFPTDDLAAFGWIERPRSWTERIETVLRFFGVSNPDAWRMPTVRSSRGPGSGWSGVTPVEPAAVAAWLRRAELEAAAIDVARWERGEIQAHAQRGQVLDDRAGPGRVCASPSRSVREVRRSGRGRASAPRLPGQRRGEVPGGWTAADHPERPVSLRRPPLVHLLPRGRPPPPGRSGANVRRRVRGLRRAARRRPARQRQTQWRASCCFPRPSWIRSPATAISPRDVIGAARAAGYLPGIMVGQLQHAGLLGFGSRLNGLKRRYAWRGATLGRA